MMSAANPMSVVLIVDDVFDNIAVLHDALDESGYQVLVASDGASALNTAAKAQPDVILLDAMMPVMDGFEVCRRLKQDLNTRHIPVIFMTGLTESEHIVAGFEAGGIDYVTKPVRPPEVLARIAAHVQTSRQMHQTRGALDAFGQAAIALTPANGRIIWQTPLARQWMQQYFPDSVVEETGNGHSVGGANMPAALSAWIERRVAHTDEPPLTVIHPHGRLIFTLAETASNEQWVVLLREESDIAQIEALRAIFKLTAREAEVLYWVSKGKTNRDIGDILDSSPRTINKHLEHIFVKLGVETRTAASSLAANKLRAR